MPVRRLLLILACALSRAQVPHDAPHQRAAAAATRRLKKSPPKKLAAAASETKRLGDGCYHVFLDVGSNRGVHGRFFFEPVVCPAVLLLAR